MSSAGDVTVVLLSLGEASTAEAVASVRRQTLAPAAIIEVRDVRPFHRALNEGARRVETPFFVQLDADMQLDPGCLAALRQPLLDEPSVGVSVGFLRDPLVGRVSGVKLFRRACFDIAQFADSISPDTDFLRDIARAGWRDVYVLHHAHDSDGARHTLGEHRPPYHDAGYTYEKYAMEGARYRYRGDAGGLRWHLRVLEQSSHTAAPLALIAMLQGIFTTDTADRLGRPAPGTGGAAVERFMRTTNTRALQLPRVWAALARSPDAAFRRCHAAGLALVAAGAYPTFARAMRMLADSDAPLRWVAQAGLCAAIVPDDGAVPAVDVHRLQPLLPPASRSLGPRRRALLCALAGRSSARTHAET